MFEKRIIPSVFLQYATDDDSKTPGVLRYVRVNEFTEESYKKFVEDCEKVINTDQGFLPIVVDSYGGYVYSLFGMADFLDSCGVRVITIAEGKSMSCGGVLFSCGAERYVGINSTLMIHDISSHLWGKDVELQNDAKECSRLNRKMYSILDRNTGKKSGYWKSLAKQNKYADLYLTANTAKKHNLATEIGIPHLVTTVSVKTELVF
jgi:ATP-dependent protease ClpP protease subunit